MIRKRQEEWNRGTKGRPYNIIQKKVREMRETSRTKKKEDIISKMRFGHTGLNSTLGLIDKHETGMCEYCNM